MTGLHLFSDGGQALWTIAVAATANLACALLGCYLLLRRMSLLGDAVSHAVLPGVVIGFWISGSTSSGWIFVTAVAVGLLATFLIQWLHGFGQVAEDASMGVVFTSLFALGVVMLVQVGPHVDLDVDCVLYGLLEIVSTDTQPVFGHEVPRAMFSMAGVLACTLLFIGLLWKELKLVSFDPRLATAMGLHATLIHYLLMGMVALAIVAGFYAVGSVLVITMLIVPAATGHLLSDRLAGMMAWAALVAVSSAVLGYAGDLRFDTGMAPMMALVAGAEFSAALWFSPRHGLVSRALHRLNLALRIVTEDVMATLYRTDELHAAGAEVGGAGVSRRGCLVAGGGGILARLSLPLLWWRGDIRRLPEGRVGLTAAGRRAAESLVRSHRLWEAYLGENFELPLDHLHESAERFEHFIGPALREELASELQQPGRDPHGKAIPGGSS
ncbi:MAG TPA: metal ABC transporter permease [Pirellulales bacterium]|jgi:ABC-type Mn2+/Zn2+ transport system permease subunit|nr:metal ABC transporter permease [Pirellulales bacterium]